MQDIIKGRGLSSCFACIQTSSCLGKEAKISDRELIVSRAKSRRMHCRCTLVLKTSTETVEWNGNQFHLPHDLSKEKRDNVFRSFNQGNQSQIKTAKSNREQA